MLSEQVYAIIKEVLPQMEQDLRAEISIDLQKQYEAQLEQQIDKTKEETKQELDEIFEAIQQQGSKQFQQRLSEFKIKEQQLEVEKSQLHEKIKMEVETQMKAQYELDKQQLAQQVIEKFNSSLFEVQIEEKLRKNLKSEYQSQMKEELNERVKCLKAQYQKQYEEDKQDMKNKMEMEWNYRYDQEKINLINERQEIEKQKFLEANRLKKLDDEKRTLREQISEQQNEYKLIISSLQQQVDELEGELSQSRKLEQSISLKTGNTSFNPQSAKFIYQKIKSSRNQPSQSEKKEQSDINPLSPPQDSLLINFSDTPIKKNDEMKPQSLNFPQYFLGQMIDKCITQSFMAKYSQQLNEMITNSTQGSEQNKENSKETICPQNETEKSTTRYLELLKGPCKQQEIKQPFEKVNNYQKIFKPNESDNSKAKQIKKLRQDILDKQQKDDQLIPKFNDQQSYMLNEFSKQFENSNQINEILEDIFQIQNMIGMPYKERIEQIRTIQFFRYKVTNIFNPIVKDKHHLKYCQFSKKKSQRYHQTFKLFQMKFLSQ